MTGAIPTVADFSFLIKAPAVYPHVCGADHRPQCSHWRYWRSIPTCAGQTESATVNHAGIDAGLSPRVRGRLSAKLHRGPSHGRVYPHVCGADSRQVDTIHSYLFTQRII